MSGLLTRLASRATGSASVLRADAGLTGFTGRSGSSGGFMAGEGDLAPAAAARRREHDWSAPAVAPVQASTPGALPVVPPPAPASADATLDTASLVQHASLASLADAARPAAELQPQSLLGPMSVAPSARPASPSIAAPAPEPAHMDNRFATAGFTAALLSSHGRSGDMGVLPAHARSSATPPGKAVEPGAEPTPLMAQGPHPAPLAAPALRARVPSTGVAAQTAGSDTEVHIHIGRIDVTALPEAPAPRRSEPKVQAPLSLDAYLAQRGRP